MPWIEATLERAEVYGPAHLVLARFLAGRARRAGATGISARDRAGAGAGLGGDRRGLASGERLLRRDGAGSRGPASSVPILRALVEALERSTPCDLRSTRRRDRAARTDRSGAVPPGGAKRRGGPRRGRGGTVVPGSRAHWLREGRSRLGGSRGAAGAHDLRTLRPACARLDRGCERRRRASRSSPKRPTPSASASRASRRSSPSQTRRTTTRGRAQRWPRSPPSGCTDDGECAQQPRLDRERRGAQGQ